LKNPTRCALRPMARCSMSYAQRAQAPVQVAIIGDAMPDAGYVSIGELAEEQLQTVSKRAIKRSGKGYSRDKLYKRERVAFHIKGYDIGRFGAIELVTLLFEKPYIDEDDHSEGVIKDGLPDIFIIDVGQHVEKAERLKRIEFIQRLLEKSTKLIKVLHNGAIIADALLHILKVRVDNISDTSSFHRVYAKEDQTVSLQEALEFAGFTPPPDSSEYDLTPGFWAKRPLTKEMVHICVEDVKQLHWLVRKQATAMKKIVNTVRSRTKSARFANSLRNLEVTVLEEQEPDIVVDFRNLVRYNEPLAKYAAMIPVPGEEGKWRCYHKNEIQLKIMRIALGYTVKENDSEKQSK